MKVIPVYFFGSLCVFVLSSLKYVQGKCGSGTFPSKFVGSDACVDCPKHWIYCKIEDTRDIKACEQFCGKVSQTTTPLPQLPLVTLTVATIDVGNVTTGATSYTADTGQHETSPVTIQPTFSTATIVVDNVTTGTTGATSADTADTGQHETSSVSVQPTFSAATTDVGATSDTTNTGHWRETSSTGDWVFLIPVVVAGLALILVVFLLWQRRRVKELKNAEQENNMQELNSLKHSSSSSSLRVGGIQETDSSCSSLLSRNGQEPESV